MDPGVIQGRLWQGLLCKANGQEDFLEDFRIGRMLEEWSNEKGLCRGCSSPHRSCLFGMHMGVVGAPV